MIFWLAIPLTLALYFATRALYRRLPWPIINPVLVPTAVIIGLLLWLDLPLEQYEHGSSPITMLLEPAVVALALPLYQQARQIQAKLKPILICTLASVLISVCTTLLIGHFMGTDPALLASLATKSITTPLAMSVSQSIGGIPAIAAAVVVVVGIVGALIGYPLLKLLKVTDPEAQGLPWGPVPTPSAPPPLPKRGSPRVPLRRWPWWCAGSSPRPLRPSFLPSITG